MIDTVVNALKNASYPWGLRVYRARPPSFTTLPVIGVYVLSEPEIIAGDGKGLNFYSSVINIDVWTKDRIEECREDVKEALHSLNMYVEQRNYHEIQEDSEIFHLVFEYFIING